MTKAFGQPITANVSPDWIETAAWKTWGDPELLVLDSTSEAEARSQITGTSPYNVIVKPIEVTLEREFGKPEFLNSIKVLWKQTHIGYVRSRIAEALVPAMEQTGRMRFILAGALIGKEEIAVAVWPDRAITDGIQIHDSFRSESVVIPATAYQPHELPASCAVCLGFSLLATAPLGKQLFTAVFG